MIKGLLVLFVNLSIFIICISCAIKYKSRQIDNNITPINSEIKLPITILPNNQIEINISDNNQKLNIINQSKNINSKNLIYPIAKQIKPQIATKIKN